jgi:hypothetical protein
VNIAMGQLSQISAACLPCDGPDASAPAAAEADGGGLRRCGQGPDRHPQRSG